MSVQTPVTDTICVWSQLMVSGPAETEHKRQTWTDKRRKPTRPARHAYVSSLMIEGLGLDIQVCIRCHREVH